MDKIMFEVKENLQATKDEWARLCALDQETLRQGKNGANQIKLNQISNRYILSNFIGFVAGLAILGMIVSGWNLALVIATVLFSLGVQYLIRNNILWHVGSFGIIQTMYAALSISKEYGELNEQQSQDQTEGKETSP